MKSFVSSAGRTALSASTAAAQEWSATAMTIASGTGGLFRCPRFGWIRSRRPSMIAAVSHSLLAFQQRFPDEAHCAQFLLERRWPDGFVCPGCGGKRGHLLRSRAYTYECVACGKQTSVTAGTVMHRTKLPLTVWFWAVMATHSNGMSAQQLMGQLGLGSYKTAWLLAQKLRRSMVDPEREPLKGVVEIDQSAMPFRNVLRDHQVRQNARHWRGRDRRSHDQKAAETQEIWCEVS